MRCKSPQSVQSRAALAWPPSKQMPSKMFTPMFSQLRREVPTQRRGGDMGSAWEDHRACATAADGLVKAAASMRTTNCRLPGPTTARTRSPNTQIPPQHPAMRHGPKRLCPTPSQRDALSRDACDLRTMPGRSSRPTCRLSECADFRGEASPSHHRSSCVSFPRSRTTKRGHVKPASRHRPK